MELTYEGRRRTLKKGMEGAALGIFVGVASFFYGVDKLTAYMEGEPLTYTKQDLMNLIFLNSNTDQYVYLDPGDSGLYFLFFFCFIIGAFVAGWDFLLINPNYYTFLYSRAENKGRAIKYMKGRGVARIPLFVFSILLVIYLLSLAALPGGFSPMQDIGELEFASYLTLHGITMCFFFMMLRELMFLLYCTKGAGIAILAALSVMILAVMLDMRVSAFHIIVLSWNGWLADSIALTAVLYVIAKFIGKRVLMKRLPF